MKKVEIPSVSEYLSNIAKAEDAQRYTREEKEKKEQTDLEKRARSISDGLIQGLTEQINVGKRRPSVQLPERGGISALIVEHLRKVFTEKGYSCDYDLNPTKIVSLSWSDDFGWTGTDQVDDESTPPYFSLHL